VIPAGSSCHLYSPSDWAYHAKVRLRIHLNGEVTAVQISGATSPPPLGGLRINYLYEADSSCHATRMTDSNK